MSDTKNKEDISCSFCNKKQHEVTHIISGASVNICDKCVEMCNVVLKSYAPEVLLIDIFED